MHVRRLRRTKLVTTLGPATDRDNNLEKSLLLVQMLFVKFLSWLSLQKIILLVLIAPVKIAARLGRHVCYFR